MAQTLEEIRQKGLHALRKELGRYGMIRFLQQFDAGRGDYTKVRHARVDNTSLLGAAVQKAHPSEPRP
jgi:hypothetical protein